MSNVVGAGGNENTILNYLENRVQNEEKLNLWTNATRNILDVEDVVGIVKLLIQGEEKNKLLNVANLSSYKITEIVSQIEEYLKKRLLLISKIKASQLKLIFQMQKRKLSRFLPKKNKLIIISPGY